MDTLGHNSVGGSIGLFKCHDAGGNQVSSVFLALKWKRSQSFEGVRILWKLAVFANRSTGFHCAVVFQDWSFTKYGQLKHDEICLAVKIGRVNEVARFQHCLDNHPNQVGFCSRR